MPALVIAIGNMLRRDDGVAHRVIELLNPHAPFTTRSVLQLTPEIALELAPYSSVIFVDADIEAKQVKIDKVHNSSGDPPLTHSSRPEEITALARSLFCFSGEAFTCRMPALDVSAGPGLSVHARRFVERAVHQIEKLMEARAAA